MRFRAWRRSRCSGDCVEGLALAWRIVCASERERERENWCAPVRGNLVSTLLAQLAVTKCFPSGHCLAIYKIIATPNTQPIESLSFIWLPCPLCHSRALLLLPTAAITATTTTTTALNNKQVNHAACRRCQ